ncbi:MAG: DUF4123 domain-containing protein [Pseudomonadota bacterium]
MSVHEDIAPATEERQARPAPVPPASLQASTFAVGPVPQLSIRDGDPWIAESLRQYLFGQPGGGLPFVRTYLVVDAAARTAVSGYFDLNPEKRHVPIESLFDGKSAETLRDTAPYLIDVSLVDHEEEADDDIPLFHRDFFGKHWGRNTGIFLRSPAPMELIRRHLRRFTRVVLPNGNWAYFRFFDPRVATAYFPTLTHKPEKIWQWFTSREGALIDAIISELPDTPGQVQLLHSRLGRFSEYDPWTNADWGQDDLVFPVARNDRAATITCDRPDKAFKFEQSDYAPMAAMMRRKRIGEMAVRLQRDFPEFLGSYNQQDMFAWTWTCVERLELAGFSRQEYIYPLAAFELLYGKGYQASDPNGTLAAILASTQEEGAKFRAYQQRMSQVFGESGR